MKMNPAVTAKVEEAHHLEGEYFNFTLLLFWKLFLTKLKALSSVKSCQPLDLFKVQLYKSNSILMSWLLKKIKIKPFP